MDRRAFSGVRVVCFVLLLLFSVSLPQAAAKGEGEAMLRLVNEAREEMGLLPVVLLETLSKRAAVRAKELTQRFSHVRPNGEPFYTAYYRGNYTMGENAAAGSASPAEIVEGWMNVPGYRRNILDARYREIGVGHYRDEESSHREYWILFFRAEKR